MSSYLASGIILHPRLQSTSKRPKDHLSELHNMWLELDASIACVLIFLWIYFKN
jgi:hypothetical protein